MDAIQVRRRSTVERRTKQHSQLTVCSYEARSMLD